MSDLARIEVTRVVKERGPRIVFRMTADLAGPASPAAVVDYLAQAFLAAVAQLGPRLDCPPEVVLVFTGARPREVQRIADIKSHLDQLWARHPQVTEVMRQKGNGFPAWSVAFVGEGGAPFDTHLSAEAGPFGAFAQCEIKKLVTGASAGAPQPASSAAKKPWWKPW
jgi:hypothetical protein